MFGYIKTDKPNLFVKDTVLYRAAYCGLCKSIGEICGQTARLVLNYDLAFLSLLCHNLLDLDLDITKQHCVVHLIGKHPIANPDDLSKRIGALNIILAYHKLSDDVIDNDKGRLKRSVFKRAYKKAVKLESNLDKIVKSRYDELLNLERKNCDSIDMICDPFGKMMQDIFVEILGDKATEVVKNLAYLLGKWIYIIDALDDFDKDLKKKSFNVFVNAYPQIKTKNDLVKSQFNDLITLFGGITSEIDRLASKLDYKFNHDLLDNVFYRGIKKETMRIMENNKCKNTTKS